MDLLKEHLIILPGLEGNTAAHLNALQRAMEAFLEPIIVFYWAAWISVLAFLIVRYVFSSGVILRRPKERMPKQSGHIARALFVGGTIVLVTLLGAIFVAQENAAGTIGQAEYLAFSEDELAMYLKGRINAVGGQRAYKEFGDLIGGLKDAQQHSHAHLFGASLYEVLGDGGFSVCDDKFLYGCFHEFTGRSIAEQGLGAAHNLNQACIDNLKERSLFCQHGIGHGVQAFFGYSDTSLKSALAVCKELPENDPIGGCYGGVFMEYNLRTMLGEEAEVRRSNSPLEPCDTLPLEFSRACSFWQSQWWRNSITADVQNEEEAYVHMGRLCTSFGSHGELDDICFRGIGNILAPGVDFEANRIKEICSVVSEQSFQRALCLISAAGRSADAVSSDEAEKICAPLKEARLAHCLAAARKTNDAVRSVKLE